MPNIEEEMAGGASQAPGPAETGAPPADPSSDRAADPRMQQAYEQVMAAATKVLYDKKTNGVIMQALESGVEQPAAAVSQVVVMIMGKLTESAKGAFPLPVLLPASVELLELVGELGEQAGLFEYTNDIHIEATQNIMQAMKPPGAGGQQQQAAPAGPEAAPAPAQSMQGVMNGQ